MRGVNKLDYLSLKRVSDFKYGDENGRLVFLVNILSALIKKGCLNLKAKAL